MKISKSLESHHYNYLVGLYKHKDLFKTMPLARIEAMAKEAVFQGVELILLNSDDIDFENRKVKGLIRDKGHWIEVERDFPEVLITDNPTPISRRDEKEQKIRNSFSITTYLLHDKQYIATEILAKTHLKHVVIDTISSVDANEIIYCAKKLVDVYLKPAGGFRGIGIFNIQYRDNIFFVKNNEAAYQFNENEFREFLSKTITKKYLIQPNIKARTKNGGVFDFRIHVQRDRTGSFQLTHQYARVSLPGKVLSNISKGASAVDLNYFLYEQFESEQADFFSKKLPEIALDIAQSIDSHYKFSIDELGIDLTIDGHGEIKFFEANAGPQSKNHEEKRAVYTIGYAIFLAEKNKNKSTFIVAETLKNQKILRNIIGRGENVFDSYKPSKKGIIYDIFSEEASKRGLITKVINRNYIEIFRENHSLGIFSLNTPNLMMPVRAVTQNKQRTKKILSSAGIYVPQGRSFLEYEQALAYFKIKKNAQVVKPIDSSGGSGVTAGIKNEDLFKTAWSEAKKYSKRVIVEDFIAGDEVRLIVLGGELIAAICRIPAYVVGDGEKTIRELVDIKNQLRKKNPITSHYPIKSFDFLLNISNKSLDEVPQKNEYIRLSSASNIGSGGEAIGVFDELDSSFKKLAKKVFDSIPGASMLGLDVLVKDFKKTASHDNAAVIGVNSDPGLGTPRFATWGTSAKDVACKILDFANLQKEKEKISNSNEVEAKLSPASLYIPACEGMSFPRKYETQIRILRQAAFSRGFKVESIDAETTVIHHKEKRHLFYQGMSDGLLFAARHATNNKQWTKRLLREAKINTPQGGIFSAEALDDAWKFACELGLPVVIKPITGSGGSGVSTHIFDFENFEKSWKYARQTKALNIIVETCYDGKDYRLVVVGNSLVAASQRIPVHVTGDGVSTIQQLVDIKNISRQNNPYHGAKLISFIPSILDHLAKSGLSSESIIPKGQTCFLQYVANIGTGGESADVTDKLHPEWAEIAVKTRKAMLNAPHIGLDLIAENISLAPDKQKWAIIEVNTNPDFGVNHFPLYGHGRDVAGALLDYLFGPQCEMQKTSVLVTVYGKVQGVGYRQWAWKAAHLRALCGWVRNQEDGSVQLMLSGHSNVVENMINECRKGSEKCKVTHIHTEYCSEYIGIGFEILK